MEFFRRNEPVLQSRDNLERPPPIPVLRLRDLTGDGMHLEKRQFSRDSDSSSSSSSGGSGGVSTTPIVIGVVVPVLIIAIILFVIWRRRQKITKAEEANDKYKSLDFGVDEGTIREKRSKGQKDAPEMSIADLKGTLRKDRGLSMDLNTANPYLLPPELHQSRESLHSLSRSINTGDDKYRATTLVPDDGSIRSPSSLKSGRDDSSIWTASTYRRFDTESKTDLLPRMPMLEESPQVKRPPPAAEKPQGGLLAPIPQEADRNSTLSTASGTAAIRASHNYLAQYISGGKKTETQKDTQPGLMVTETEVQPTPPPREPQELPAAAAPYEQPKRQSSLHGSRSLPAVAQLTDTHHVDQPKNMSQLNRPQIATPSYELDDTARSQFPKRSQSKCNARRYSQQARRASSQQPPVPDIRVEQQHAQDDAASDYYDEEVFDEYQDYMGYTYRGSLMGARPLPPDDPSENPEQRANRIRSFYKEYFDDSGKAGTRQTSYHNQITYYDGSEQYEDDVYDYYEQSHSRGLSMMSDGRQRAFSHGNNSYDAAGPRAYSSMSGRMGPRQKIPPKKKQPPPKPLMVLPTPHKLKDDDFLPNAIDYAPPQMFKNQRSGTPDSLRGGLRPYSPSVRPHVPLTSSFDDLAVVPSPHSLRKSGTFTALDFAPPRRFKENGEAISETGSVRSNRSNLSRMHLANIRNGAYRVSRIPTDVAGTKDDMYTALRPKWDMRGDAAVPGR